MKSILLAAMTATALATTATVAMAADSTMIFRWRAGLVMPVAGHSGGGSSEEGGEHGGGSGGSGGGGTGGGDPGGGDGSGDGGSGDGNGGSVTAMRFSGGQYGPTDDFRESVRAGGLYPFVAPVIIADTSSDYHAGDTLPVCWDTELLFGDEGIHSMGWRLTLWTSNLVSAVTVGGIRHPVDASASTLVLEGGGAAGCADIELGDPAADDGMAWGMGVNLQVTAVAEVYSWWWGRLANNEYWNSKDDPTAFDLGIYEGPASARWPVERIEAGS